MSLIFLVRHCQTTGQEPDAPLTALGDEQAHALAAFLLPLDIERIVASPYRRAVQSIAPFAQTRGLTIETDARLRERTLSPTPDDVPATFYSRTFTEPELALPGGESSREAGDRAEAVLNEARAGGRTTALISHGNLLALLLDRYRTPLGFDGWRALTNPDVYRIRTTESETTLVRLWSTL
jgi:2,3-bisphosphoglycerate-dependent phosphoglycerate mutase